MKARHPVALKRVQFDLPGTADAVVRRGVSYGTPAPDGNPRVLNVYLPAAPGGPWPTVLFVFGLPDAGARTRLGCAMSEMACYDSWARLVAASGMAGVTYTTGAEPLADAREVLTFLRAQAADLGLDLSRVGVWSCSANVPVALDLLHTSPPGVACATLLYGLMRDVDVPPNVQLRVVRAGQDAVAGINRSIDAFVAAALRRNLPMTLVNHSSAGHAFDLEDAGTATAGIVRDILGFLAAALRRMS